MDKTYSVMLNAARFMAALFVFFSHAEYLLHEPRLSPVASFGHDAVIFFFILSGFVVSFTAQNKESSLTDFAVARCARLYSVVIPALVLTFLSVLIGSQLGFEEYAAHLSKNWSSIFASSFFFLNESTFVFAEVPVNAPYWSLNYEAWYYFIFGLAFYVQGAKKYLLVALAALIAGPKVLLLMPIWLAGAAFYAVHKTLQTRRLLGYVAIVLPLLVYLWIRARNLDDAVVNQVTEFFGGQKAYRHWANRSERFVSDYMIAVLFLCIVYGMYMVRDHFKAVAAKFQRPVAMLADGTFTLYLLHYPLLSFFSHVFNNSLLSMLLCAASVALISLITERQKNQLAVGIRRVIGAPLRRSEAK